MTSDRKIIKDETGYEIGKVYLRGFGCETEEKEYDVCESGNNVYDEGSGSFHLFPKLCLHNNAEVKLWNSYFSITENERGNILKLLQDKSRWERCGLIVNLEQNATLRLVKGETKADTVYLLNGAGKSGIVRGFPYNSELDHFFRNLYVYLNRRFYCLNFMRFFIENNNEDRIINCIYGEFQFDTTADKYRRVNKGKSICYPSCKHKQPYSEIELRGEYQACVYNPDVKNVVSLENDEGSLADEFIRFIKEVEKQLKA